MQIDENILKKLEKLSSLEIADADAMIAELNKIVGFMDNISNVNTDGVSSVFSMSDNPAQLRADAECVDRDISAQILADAPSSRDNFFVVPKIIG